MSTPTITKINKKRNTETKKTNPTYATSKIKIPYKFILNPPHLSAERVHY
jgi:hypothetical protein